MANNFPLIISQHLWLDQRCLSFYASASVLLIIPVLLILFTRNVSKRSSGGKMLNLPPSPPRLPVIGNLHQLGKLPHRSLRALSEKYGPLMLLQLGQAAPTLVVSSPDLVKEIAKNHDTTFSNRPQTTATDVLFYGGKDVAFSTYGEYWSLARRVCALQLLSLKRVQSFQSIREEVVTKLVERLRKASLKGNTSVNLSEILMSASNNIICRCVLGENYETERDGGSRIGELSRRMLVQFLAFSVADFFPSLRWVDVLRGFIASLKSTSRALDAFYGQVIEEHKAIFSSTSSRPEDFVDILLQLQKHRNTVDSELTNIHIKAVLQDMLVGGNETSSTLMEWLMSELINNPRAMKKAQEEVRRVVGVKTKVEKNDIDRMDYLKCVIKESLRLHPSTPLLLPRETSKSVEIGGYHIPAGAKVIVNAWAIHRHPSFWEEPEEFIPERFENNPVDFKSQEYFETIPFGFGRRQCPGMTFAIFGIEYVIANLLYWFDWKLPTINGGNTMPEKVDMTETFGLTVHRKVPLRVIPIYYS